MPATRGEVTVGERPKMCPSCGKLMGIARICPYCGADASAVGTRIKAIGRSASASEDGGTPVTFVLLVVMTAIYVASVAFGGTQEGGGLTMMFSPTPETQIRLGAMVPSMVEAGEWWRLVTANFLHWGVIHLLFNAMAIWMLGRAYEEEVGPASMLVLFILSGIAGFAFSYAVGDPSRIVAGASAGGFALMGAVIGRRRLTDGHFRDPRTMRAFELAILNLVMGFAIGADNWAHLGGLVAGVAVAWLQARYERQHLVWTTLAGGLGALTLASGAFAVMAPAMPAGDDVNDVLACRGRVSEVVTDDLQALRYPQAEALLECLERTHALGEEADPLVLAMKTELRSALRAQREGASKVEREAVAALFVATARFDRWVADYARRLGVRLERSR